MARLDFKLSETHKNIIAQAASAEGVSMSDYVISSALRSANTTLESHVVTRILGADLGAICQAMFEPKQIAPEIISNMKQLQETGGSFEIQH